MRENMRAAEDFRDPKQPLKPTVSPVFETLFWSKRQDDLASAFRGSPLVRVSQQFGESVKHAHVALQEAREAEHGIERVRREGDPRERLATVCNEIANRGHGLLNAIGEAQRKKA